MAGKVKAGAAFVEIGADSKGLLSGLKRAADAMRKFGGVMQSIGKKLVIAGAAMLAPLVLSAKSFAKFGDDAAKMARRTGIAAQSLVEIGYAAELSGGNIAGLEKALKRMQSNIVDAGLGLSTALDSFRLMNLTLSELQGLTPEKQFLKIAGALGKMADATKRAGVANKFFGRSGTQLLPLFALTADEMEAMRKEARLLFGALGKEGFDAAEELSDRFTRLTSSFQGLKNVIGSQIEPAASSLVDRLTGIAVRVRELLEMNPRLVLSFAKIAKNLTIAGAAFTAFGATFVIATSPLTAVIALLASLTVALLSILESLDILDMGVNLSLKNIFNNFTLFGKSLNKWAEQLALDISSIFLALFVGIAKGMRSAQTTSAEIRVNLPLALQAAAQDTSTPEGALAAQRLRNQIDANRKSWGVGAEQSGSEKILADMLEENRRRRIDIDLNLEKGKPSFSDAAKALADKLEKLIATLIKPIPGLVPSKRPGEGDEPGGAEVSRQFGIHGFFGGQNAREQMGGGPGIQLQRQMAQGIATTNDLLGKIERKQQDAFLRNWNVFV